jgi:hypothetical protein
MINNWRKIKDSAPQPLERSVYPQQFQAICNYILQLHLLEERPEIDGNSSSPNSISSLFMPFFSLRGRRKLVEQRCRARSLQPGSTTLSSVEPANPIDPSKPKNGVIVLSNAQTLLSEKRYSSYLLDDYKRWSVSL